MVNKARVSAIYRVAGFTIVEMSVVMLLLSILLVVLALYFTKARHYFIDIDTYSTLQRETSIVGRKISELVSRADSKNFTFANQNNPSDNPSYFYFITFTSDSPSAPYIEFFGPTHQIVWKRWLGFYHVPSQNKLVEVSIPLSPALTDLISPPLPAMSYTKLTGTQGQSIGRDIKQIAISKTRIGDKWVVNMDMLASTVSPVPLRNEEDKLIEIDYQAQVILPN